MQGFYSKKANPFVFYDTNPCYSQVGPVCRRKFGGRIAPTLIDIAKRRRTHPKFI